MYNWIEADLKGVQQSLYSSRAMSTALLSSGGIEVGYEPAQLHRIVDVEKAHLHWVKEEK
jgi:hypothetical protein